MFCRTETGGNVVSWQSAQLNITGLDTDLIDREETCPGHQDITHFMAFNTKLDFHDSIREVFIKKNSVNDWPIKLDAKSIHFRDFLYKYYLDQILSKNGREPCCRS